jgi:hypothetical protein
MYNNARWHLSERQVENCAARVSRQRQLDADDRVSTYRKLESLDECVAYQKLDDTDRKIDCSDCSAVCTAN